MKISEITFRKYTKKYFPDGLFLITYPRKKLLYRIPAMVFLPATVNGCDDLFGNKTIKFKKPCRGICTYFSGTVH